ncbi:hypothetical protein A2U01_0073768, partial [Trifolium medium]|nr:hypothetical protein [Trifolium medium]
NITERLADEDYDDIQGMRDKEPLDKPEEGEYEEEGERRPDTPSPGDNSVATSSNLRPHPRGGTRDQVVMTEVSTVRTHRNKRTSSCPPEARRSVISG